MGGVGISTQSAQKKRIYNPVTGKYYEVRQHSSKYGTAGEIPGFWSSKKKKQYGNLF